VASLTIYTDSLLQVSDNPEANLKRIGAVVHTDRTQANINVVAQGSMDWAAVEDLTVEKKTANITLGVLHINAISSKGCLSAKVVLSWDSNLLRIAVQ